MPHVVDSNVINLFQKERLEAVEKEAHVSINALMNDCCIALDDSGVCQSEWVSCAGGTFPLALADWISDMLVVQRIRLFPFCADSKHKELTGLGLPKKDHKWVRLAVGSKSKIIVTDDIDLFDPSKKNASSAIKASTKIKGSGPVSKYLRKKYGILVACPSRVVDTISEC